MIPDSIEIGTAMQMLVQAFPDEHVKIEAHFNERPWPESPRGGLAFSAVVGDRIGNDRWIYTSNHESASDAVTNIIEKGKNRQSQQDALKAKLERAKSEVEKAEKELIQFAAKQL